VTTKVVAVKVTGEQQVGAAVPAAPWWTAAETSMGVRLGAIEGIGVRHLAELLCRLTFSSDTKSGEGGSWAMLSLSHSVGVYLASKPVDRSKSIDELTGIVHSRRI